MRRPVGQCALLLTFAQAVLASLARSACPIEPPAWRASARYEVFGYPDSERLGSDVESFFSTRLHAEQSITPEVYVQAEARVVADEASYTAGAYSWRNAGRRRPYLSINLAQLDYAVSDELRLSAGLQRPHWSVMDLLTPANLVAARDQSDPFRATDVGVPSVSLHYETEPVAVDFIVVPMVFTVSRLPQGRWSIVPTSVQQSQSVPPVRVDETQAGLRVGGRFGQLEAALLAYVGRDAAPIFVPNVIFLDFGQLAVELVAEYPRLASGGTTMTMPILERGMMRFESVYLGSTQRNRADFLQTVGSFEYTYREARATLGYFRSDVVVGAAEEITSQGSRTFFQSFLFGQMAYDTGRKLKLELSGGYDTDEGFYLLAPSVSLRLWSQVKLTLGAQVIGAQRLSYFQRVRHEDRIGTALEYSL